MGYLLIAISTHFPLRSELVLGQYRLRKEKQFLCRRQEVPCQGMQCFHWAQPTYSMAHSEGTEVLFSFGSPGICSPHYLVKLTPLTQSQSQAEALAHFFRPLSKLQVNLKPKQNGEVKSVSQVPLFFHILICSFSSPDDPMPSLLPRLPLSGRKMNRKRNRWLNILPLPETSIF